MLLSNLRVHAAVIGKIPIITFLDKEKSLMKILNKSGPRINP